MSFVYSPSAQADIVVARYGPCDFLLPSSGGETKIEQAVDAAIGEGRNVYIRGGFDYNLNAPPSLAGRSGFIVRGDGMGRTVIKNCGFNKNDNTTTSNVQFRDMTIDINSVSGVNAMNLNNNSVAFRLINVEMKNTNNRFLMQWGMTDDLVVWGCRFLDSGLAEARDCAAGSQLVTTENMAKFLGCYFHKTSASTAGGGLLTTGQTGNLYVDGCTFNNEGATAYAGISIEHQTGNSKDFICTGNRFYKCGPQTNVQGQSNILENVVISNNIVYGDVPQNSNTGGGIIKAASARTATVTGNIIRDSKYGIWLQNNSIAIAGNNVIRNTNTSSHGTASDKGGFWISGNDIVNLNNNIVHDTLGTTPYGIYIVGGSQRIYGNDNKMEGPFVTAPIASSGTQAYLKLHDNRFNGTPALGTVTTKDYKNNDGLADA